MSQRWCESPGVPSEEAAAPQSAGQGAPGWCCTSCAAFPACSPSPELIQQWNLPCEQHQHPHAGLSCNRAGGDSASQAVPERIAAQNESAGLCSPGTGLPKKLRPDFLSPHSHFTVRSQMGSGCNTVPLDKLPTHKILQ